MLETINDYISFIISILILFFALRILSGVFSMNKDDKIIKRESIIFDYQNNEDD